MGTIREYHLRIVPPEPIYSDIVNFKSQFIDTFGKLKYSKSKPHITLALFRMDMEYQDIIVKNFNQLSSIKKFQLEINGFNIFDIRAHVLFLDIPISNSIKNVQTNIKMIWERDLHGKSSKLNSSKLPHMTISTTKDKETLYASFDLFKKKGYHKSFEVDHIVLTSRLLCKTWDWEQLIPLSD